MTRKKLAMKCGHQILLNNCLFHACRHLCQESGHNIIDNKYTLR
jgi:hypothetical protein